MTTYTYSSTTHHFASAYGEGSFSTSMYNGDNTSTAPGIVAPGAPNTGFFNSVFSSASETSLIPFLFGIAIVIGMIAVITNRLIKRHRSRTATK